MRRFREQEEILTVEEGGETIYEEAEVGAAVCKFYKEWMASRVSVTDRFLSWDTMLDMNPDALKDKKHRGLLEQAYGDAKRKFERLQREEGIWDGIRLPADMRELKKAVFSMASGTAPGPTGLTYDLIKMLTDDQLEPILQLINDAMSSGKVEEEMNRSLIRPLPKTDQGLSDLSKTRPIALMETLLKILERIIFSRVMGVMTEHGMLRMEQHGGLHKRSARTPIRVITELIEDAIMSGKELHVFSADISKAFDSLEYWSQAMGWRALGMPKELVTMLVDMDEQGSTAVILGQGRTTATIDSKKGWFHSERGVRQGSVGGPIKWVVFINFWLEYVHKEMANEGYTMSQAELGDKPTLANVFVDDSNWFTANSGAMARAVQLGEAFTSFHGLAFNKSKCEYLAVNQEQLNDGSYERPTWVDGSPVVAKMRKKRRSEGEKEAKEAAEDAIMTLKQCMLKETGEATSLADKHAHDIANARLADWTYHIQRENEEGIQIAGDELRDAINEAKTGCYGTPMNKERGDMTLEWMETWHYEVLLAKEVGEGRGEATRYLGVWYELNMKWARQRKILHDKFEGLHSGISGSLC
jgi:hypothetical protein